MSDRYTDAINPATEIERLRAEVDRLRAQWLTNVEMTEKAVNEQRRAERAEAKLSAWESAESLPDCPACAALAAAEGETQPHAFQPCDRDGEPGHNFTCALLCTVCGLPEDRHAAAKE